jgi:hypothetical protein
MLECKLGAEYQKFAGLWRFGDLNNLRQTVLYDTLFKNIQIKHQEITYIQSHLVLVSPSKLMLCSRSSYGAEYRRLETKHPVHRVGFGLFPG